MDTKFKVLRELFVELGLVFLVFSYFSEHFKASLDHVLFDHLEYFVLLQHFSRDVQRQVIRIDDTFDKAEPLWDEFLAVVHDEDSPDVQLDVVFLLLAFEEVLRCSLGREEHSFEFQLAFYGEVLD